LACFLRKEFSLPVVKGSQWQGPAGGEQISSLDARVSVPAGNFSNCLKVSGGAAGARTEERDYALGVGLVYETASEKGVQYSLKLVSMHR
jgi:hypothetical protein